MPLVVDLGLPDIDGADVIRGIRGWTELPIVVLSARQGLIERVEALDAGAGDYVTKPFASTNSSHGSPPSNAAPPTPLPDE